MISLQHQKKTAILNYHTFPDENASSKTNCLILKTFLDNQKVSLALSKDLKCL